MPPKVKKTAHRARPFARGFTMIELLVVVALIVIMAGVAIPSIATFLRTYRLRGATREIAGEIQTARNKAIMTNANAAVVFTILDSDSYRFYIPDDNPLNANPPPRASLGPVRDLPQGLNFLPARATSLPPTSFFGFDRLGRSCRVGATTCIGAARLQPAGLLCPPDDQPRCSNWTPGTYIELPDLGGARVRIRERQTGLEREVTVAAGGRVAVQR